MYTLIKNTLKKPRALRRAQLFRLPFVFACAFLFVCCTSSPKGRTSKAPLWVSEPGSVYADNAYLTAVGSAPSRRGAEAEAIAALTKSVSQKVEVQSSSIQTFEAERQSVRRDFSSTVKTSAAIDNISGITIKETWTSADGTVYALALIEREQTGSYYAQKFKNAEDGINAFILFAAEHPAGFEAVAALHKALTAADENEQTASILAVIHPGKFKHLSPAYKNVQTVHALLYREIEKIGIAVEVQNDKNRRIGAAFLHALKEAGYKTAQNTGSEAASAMPYVLRAELSFEPFEGKSSENKYVRYSLKAELADKRTGKIVLPWSVSGREAHFTQAEAENRALRTLESNIKEDFLKHMLTIGS